MKKNRTLSAVLRTFSAVRRIGVIASLALIAGPVSADIFVDVGAQTSRVKSRIANMDDTVETTESGAHFGIGASRRAGEKNEFGVRLELDNVGSDLFLAVRALDYRRHLTERFSVSGFLGAARLDLATPAYGWYMGGGVQLKDILPSWDLNLDLRYGDKVARDNLLPTDPQGGSPDNFHDVAGISVYLSYRF